MQLYLNWNCKTYIIPGIIYKLCYVHITATDGISDKYLFIPFSIFTKLINLCIHWNRKIIVRKSEMDTKCFHEQIRMLSGSWMDTECFRFFYCYGRVMITLDLIKFQSEEWSKSMLIWTNFILTEKLTYMTENFLLA